VQELQERIDHLRKRLKGVKQNARNIKTLAEQILRCPKKYPDFQIKARLLLDGDFSHLPVILDGFLWRPNEKDCFTIVAQRISIQFVQANEGDIRKALEELREQ
jgi:predicted kinase